MLLFVIGCCCANTPEGARKVCFEKGACVDLTTVQSTPLQRALLNATCDVQSSYYFPWGTKTVDPCDFKSHDWRDEACKRMLRIPGLSTEFWADIAAVRMQNWFAFEGSLGGTSKGIPGLLARNNFTLPANYEIPLTLISSGYNRLRDLTNASRADLLSCAGNTAGNRQDNYDSRHPAQQIVYSGVDGQSSGDLHPQLPYCNAQNHTHVSRFVLTDYTSTSLKLVLASVYAGRNGSMMVWESSTAGNQPFSGDYEWLPSPGARFKQLQCDLFPLSAPYIARGLQATLIAISFAYETTHGGERTPSEEVATLQRLRDAFYNNSLS